MPLDLSVALLSSRGLSSTVSIVAVGALHLLVHVVRLLRGQKDEESHCGQWADL